MPMLALLFERFERFERSDQPRHHAALLRCVSELQSMVSSSHGQDKPTLGMPGVSACW